MMYRILTFFALLVAVACHGIFLQKSINNQWLKFKNIHAKNYQPHEEQKKQKVFATAVKRVLLHNLQADMGILTVRLGINKYSDMPHEEFVRKMTGLQKDAIKTRSITDIHERTVSDDKLPKEVDWRQRGAVTDVKDQGECGSCWTFSATGAMEGAWFNKHNSLVSLSEQNLVDCASKAPYKNNGCDGGLPDSAFQYVIDNKGINKEECYPYYSMELNCYFNKKCVSANLTRYVTVEEGSEAALKEAVATVGPISVAMDASDDSLQNYRSGVYGPQGCVEENLNHAVLLVGYGTTPEGQDYWLIKNSWGTTWGDEGYIKIARNKGNMCGVATYAVYPVV